ncbi:hypothetical protein TSUD_67240 [Trifolium subterraneum]|uniref:Uncharacterized protein n=1 Tax=Trifolium subterraneum TaxID=3900 RepID=A0A2Z6MPZ5_TRISU|nr:hypothetical protein TSUD_67240 [Trifolium subterraneum]
MKRFNCPLAAERIQILESEVESKKAEADITISKLKKLLEEKEQCILQHKEREKKLKHRILDDGYMKYDQSAMLKRLRKNFEATLKVLKSEFQDKFQKHEKHFAEVSVQKDKQLLSTDTFLTDLNRRAVKAFEETEEWCRKILADCSEESTRQQLMHIQELVTHMQQGHSEQLKRLREVQHTHTYTKQDRSYDGGEMRGHEMEELMGDYESSDSD